MKLDYKLIVGIAVVIGLTGLGGYYLGTRTAATSSVSTDATPVTQNT